VTAKVPVREAGVYHLFVRSIGTAASSFHVKIDGKLDPGTYGHGKLAWQQGGTFTLKPGTVEIRLTSIVPRSVAQCSGAHQERRRSRKTT